MTDAQKPVHAPLTNFRIANNCLEVGGVPLPLLAARAGGTPFFAYERRALADRVGQLRRHLPERVHISYAVKANPMPAVVQYLAGLVDGFDIASAGELKTTLDTAMPPDRISFAGPGKRRAELRQAVAAGILVNMETEGEMAVLAALAEELGVRPRVGVRVNPEFELKSSGIRMGGGAKQFGVDAERVPAMLRRIAELDLGFEGFHVFTGSQNLRANTLIDVQQKTVDLALSLAQAAPCAPRFINIGGGFGIPYFPGDVPLDLAPIGDSLARLVQTVDGQLDGCNIVVELGRYIVGEAGIYVCQVIDRKVSREQVFLVTDGGLHHQFSATGNFGQIIRKNYPLAVGNRMASVQMETVTVAGCLCTPVDVLGERVDLPRADVGDLIVIFQSGAYGPSASPAGFLGHPPATEILV